MGSSWLQNTPNPVILLPKDTYLFIISLNSERNLMQRSLLKSLRMKKVSFLFFFFPSQQQVPVRHMDRQRYTSFLRLDMFSALTSVVLSMDFIATLHCAWLTVGTQLNKWVLTGTHPGLRLEGCK